MLIVAVRWLHENERSFSSFSDEDVRTTCLQLAVVSAEASSLLCGLLGRDSQLSSEFLS
jgi:hypothetical protein